MSRAVALPLPVLITAVMLPVGAVLASQALLEGFYARSGYPVPYYVGQLSFGAASLQGWYGDMLDCRPSTLDGTYLPRYLAPCAQR